MGDRDLLEVLYLASVGDGDPSPTRWYRRQNTGDREARQRRRAWILVGLVAAVGIAAAVFDPKVLPPGAPHASADIGRAVEELQNQPVIYQPCKMLAWAARFGVGCAPQLDEDDGD